MEKTYKRYPFNIELAKKIQSGEVAGRLLMKPYKSEKIYPVIILTCDAVHNRKIKGSIDIVVLVQFEDGDVAIQFNSDGYGLDVHGNDVRLLIELPEKALKHEFKPFDKVLVRQSDTDDWRVALYSHYNQKSGLHVTAWLSWYQCIPYNEETAHLVGTTNKSKGYD